MKSLIFCIIYFELINSKIAVLFYKLLKLLQHVKKSCFDNYLNKSYIFFPNFHFRSNINAIMEKNPVFHHTLSTPLT